MPLFTTKGVASAQGLGMTLSGDSAVYVEDVISTQLRVGTGASAAITTGLNGVANKTLVWTKARSTTTDHKLTDSVRGATKALSSNSTAAEVTDSQGLTSFDVGGYTIGSGSDYNSSGQAYVDWQFTEAAKFFTVTTINHTNGTPTTANLSSLGTVGYVHAKIVGSTGDWIVWHRSLSPGTNLRLNTTAIPSASNAWLSVSGTTATLSASAPTGTYIVHAFAHNAGGFGVSGNENVVACGSFNLVSNPWSANIGFEPQWLLVRSVDYATDWYLVDNMRGFSTRANFDNNETLYANTSDDQVFFDTLYYSDALGFSGNLPYFGNYIYVAIRRGPMRTPTLGTSVFSPVVSSAATGTQLTTNFPVDMQWLANRSGSFDNVNVVDRIRGVSSSSVMGESGNRIMTASTSTQNNTYLPSSSWGNNGFLMPSTWAGSPDVFLNFRRAPRFFEQIIMYQSNTANPHGLTVIPEFVIMKRTNVSTQDWYAVHKSSLGFFNINTTSAAQSANIFPNSIAPSNAWITATASTINAGNFGTGTPGAYTTLYLFASCPGVSFVGSYTGSGGTQEINCGFNFGARFVLIKAASAVGDWLLWDSARGIVAGDDPYLVLNSTAAEVTNTDWVDTSSTGFTVSDSVGNMANTLGVSYIYMAIA